MASNKNKREELQKIYGKGSMFKKAKTEEYLSTLPNIKSFKKFQEEKHYTRKQKLKYEETMTYHHMQHLAEGGKTTCENGAVVSEGEHIYLHSLPRVQEEIANRHMKQWKFDYIILTAESVVQSGEIDIDINQDFIEIPAEDYYKPHKTKLTAKQLEEKQRRQEKRELQRIKKELEDR